MAIDEIRMRLRRKLEEAFGVDEADLLMDRPPGGWSDLATHRHIDALESRIDRRFDDVDRRFADLETRFDSKLDALRHELVATMERGFQAQTWRLIAALTALIGIFAAVVKI